MEDKIILFLIVGFLIYFIVEIYKSSKMEENIEEDNDSKELNDDVNSINRNWDFVKETYPIGKWDKEIRENLHSIVDIKTKYKCNKELSVLVGDYNKEMVSNTISVLESLGIKTTAAKSGVEIIKRIENGEKYDLIISNNIYDRGHCDGPETLAHLKDIKGFNIPVSVLTVSENERNRFIHVYGFDEYMTKCLTQEEVFKIFPNLFKDIKFTKIKQ